jgi:hypothetical protein
VSASPSKTSFSTLSKEPRLGMAHVARPSTASWIRLAFGEKLKMEEVLLAFGIL